MTHPSQTPRCFQERKNSPSILLDMQKDAKGFCGQVKTPSKAWNLHNKTLKSKKG
jgi:hypothetical protein